MRRRTFDLFFTLVVLSGSCRAQSLSPRWEELTAADFTKAIQQARGVCMLPMGVIEKHGPSGPLGTDVINVHHVTVTAAAQEYAIVFPQYYVGQIFEAKHQPGTIAYSTRLQLDFLQETVSEMVRNGCRKVAIVSGHGGNNNLVSFFAQTQLDSPKDYVVYVISSAGTAEPEAAKPSKPGVDGHAGEGEMSNVMAVRPELVHPERATSQSGANLRRLVELPRSVYTGIWWYAQFPNHYEGDASGANAARGQAAVKARADSIATAIRAIKADSVAPKLQQEFFDASRHPLDTKQ
jgi:creatinine amidohydrolase